jgi:hypothetical protein
MHHSGKRSQHFALGIQNITFTEKWRWTEQEDRQTIIAKTDKLYVPRLALFKCKMCPFSGFGSRIRASFFFKLSRTMSMKKDRSGVSSGGNMTISIIPMGVRHPNITFFAPRSCLGRVGRLTSALTHIADLGFSKQTQVSCPVMT